MTFPDTEAELLEIQRLLATRTPPPWRPQRDGLLVVAGCFVCFERRAPSGPGRAGESGVAAAALLGAGDDVISVVEGVSSAAFQVGLLALREGPLLERAVRSLSARPDVLFVNASGRDHPRGAGLALHLGAVLELPTVGVTSRPLCATGEPPPDLQGAMSPVLLDGKRVGVWVRTRPGTRPLVAHAAWRTDPDTAAEILLLTCQGTRTPEPIRRAREAARTRRAIISR